MFAKPVAALVAVLLLAGCSEVKPSGATEAPTGKGEPLETLYYDDGSGQESSLWLGTFCDHGHRVYVTRSLYSGRGVSNSIAVTEDESCKK